MKSKKGFTLIELLAIIVILAIIAVITVPIILNIIENSKKGAASDSAYGFKDAVNKAYVTKLSGDSDYNITDGTYTVSDLKTQIGLSVSGKEPGENSWVTISKNNVTTGCLQYDDYKVEFTDGKVSNTEKGECEVSSNDSQITTVSVGDEVCYGLEGSQECFKVIKKYTENDVEKVMLFADNNLKKNTDNTSNPAVITYKQSATSYDMINFSSSTYWISSNALVSSYSNNGEYSFDSTNNKFVNTNNTQVYPDIYDAISKTNAYVEGYLTTLKTIYDAPSSITGRLLTYNEAKTTTIFANNDARKNDSYYWLGSVRSAIDVWLVSYDGSFGYLNFNDHCGVRPVIIVPTSDL